MATTTVMNTSCTAGTPAAQQETFYQDVIRGLSCTPKQLDSKYFYDTAGDRLFQQIMQCREYYPTACEMEILKEQAARIAQAIRPPGGRFNVVELGAGDATKSVHLLRQLLQAGAEYTYYPIDISAGVITLLEKELPRQLPGLAIQGLNGDYFDMLEQVSASSPLPKVLLFMGGNIGNFTPAAARQFCRGLRRYLQPGDLLLTGFDLKKHPRIILNAYNDTQGITRAFNLNLLQRINRELGADFNLAQFEHYATYDPGSGACKSYLVSQENQQVQVGGHRFHFALYEAVFTEISQKYSLEETEQLAMQTGFTPVARFLDSREWFADCLWKV